MSDVSSGTFEISIVDDDPLADAGEIFLVTISGPSGGGGAMPVISREGTTVESTIIEVPLISVLPLSTHSDYTTDVVDEDVGMITFYVQMDEDAEFTGSATANWEVRQRLGVESSEAVSGSGTLTFLHTEAGVSGRKEVTVMVIDDEIAELHSDYSDVFQVVITTVTVNGVADPETLAPGNAATVTITDNDIIALELEQTSVAVEGGSAEYTVSVKNNVVPQGNIAFSIAISYGTTQLSDFGIFPNCGTIANGTVVGTFQIPIVDDYPLMDAGEVFLVTIGNPFGSCGESSFVNTVDRTVASTVLELPILGIASMNPSVDEDVGTVSFSVSLRQAVADSEVRVNWAVEHAPTNGTSDADFGGMNPSGVITFSAADHSDQVISVPISDDRLVEVSESFSVALSIAADSPAVEDIDLVIGTSRASVTITDNDFNAVALSLSTGTLSETEVAPDSLTITATVSLEDPAGDTGSVPRTVNVSVDPTTSTARFMDDYAIADPSPFRIDIPADSPHGYSATVNLAGFRIIDDAEIEGSETIAFTAVVTDGISPLDTVSIRPATFTITDDASDTAGRTVGFGATTYSVNEGDGASANTVDVLVNYAGGAGANDVVVADVTVSAPDSGMAAVEGTHFTLSSKQVVIPAGATVTGTPITITTVPNDMPSGSDRAFTLTMTTSVNGVTTGTGGTTVTIVEDDPPDIITLSLDNSTVAEDGDAVTVTVTATVERNSGNQEDLIVGWRLSGTATNGTDYATITPVNFFFGANSTEDTISVTIAPTQDALIEGDESIIFDVTFASYSATPTQFQFVAAVFALTDDDTTTVTIARKAGEMGDVTEGASATFTAVFGAAIAPEVTITWGQDSDLTGTSATIVSGSIVSGSLAQDFTVPVTNDMLAEGQEIINMTFDVPGGFITNDTVTGAVQSFTVAASDPITISVAGPDVHLEGVTEDYIVTLTGGAPSADVTVVVSADGFAGGTTVPDANDVTLPPSVTIVVPATTATFPITMVEDGLQPEEVGNMMTLTFTGSGSGGASFYGGAHTVTISQLPALSVMADRATVAEDAGAATFTVKLSGPVVGLATVVEWTVSHTATSDDDFGGMLPSGTFTFAAGKAGDQDFAVSITDDSLEELNETFSVGLSVASHSPASAGVNVVVETARAFVTIADDDYDFGGGTVRFLSSEYTVSEGDLVPNSVNVPVNYNGRALPSDAIVDIALGAPTTGNVAQENMHFMLSTKQITIPTGSTSISVPITVTTVPDSTPSGSNRAFSLTMASASGIVLGTAMTTVTIVDDDPQDVVTLTLDNVTAAEDGSAVTVTVTATVERNIGEQEGISVAWTLDGTATNGTDYEMVTPASISIAANATSATTTVTITPTQDTDIEGDETILFDVTSGSYSNTQTTFKLVDAVFTLTDDDTTTVTIKRKMGETGDVAEGASATFTASFGAAIARAVTITWGENPDVDGTSATIAAGSIVSGSLAQDFTVPVTDDMLAEGRETIIMTFDVPGGFITSDSVTGAVQTLTIGASDPITIVVDGPDIHNEGEREDYTVTLTGGIPTQDVTIWVNLSGVTGGTAVADADDVILPDFITISPSGTTAMFTITMVDDGYQPEEVGNVMALTFTGWSYGGATLISSTREVTINQLPSVEIVAGATTITEDGGAMEFTVSISNPVADAMDIDWNIIHTETEDVDFSGATSGTISFAANDADDKAFSVMIADDSLAEITENFRVMLTFASSSAQLDVVIGTPVASGSIIDNEVIGLSLAETTAPREGASAVYTVATDGSIVPTADIMFNIVVTHGTSTAADLGTVPGSGMIMSGMTSGTFEISIVDDDPLKDHGEAFIVTISAPVGGGGASPTITMASVESTIRESPSISVLPLSTHVSEDDEAVDENVGAITLYLQMDEGVGFTGSATATWEVRQFSSMESSEDASGSGTVTFVHTETGVAGRKEITVTILDDDLAEPDSDGFEVVITGVTVNGSEDLAVLVPGDRAAINITDNDIVALELEQTSPAVEGESAEYTVSVKDGVVPTVDIAFDIAVSRGTTQASDLGVVPSTGTIAAGVVTGTFQIPIVDDDPLLDASEVFLVTISNPMGGGGATPIVGTGDRTVVTTILDLASLGITAMSRSVDEGAVAVTFIVSLSRAVINSEVRVNWTVEHAPTNGTSDADFGGTKPSGVITFAAGDYANQTITVPINDDRSVEASESFSVVLSIAPDSPAVEGTEVLVGTPRAFVTITDNEFNLVTLSLSLDSLGETEMAPEPLMITATVGLSDTTGDTGSDPWIVNVSVDPTMGTASVTDDFAITDSPPFAIAIPANSPHDYSSTVNLAGFSVADDAEIEGSETIVFTAVVTDGLGPIGTVVVRPATFTITDDAADAAGRTVGFGAATYSVNEGDGVTANTVDVEVNFNGGVVASDVVVADVTISTPDSGTAAVEGTHFTLSSKQVVIPAGAITTGTPITITTVPDDAPSGSDRAFTLTMTTSISGVTIGASKTTVTIVEDDKLPDVITLTLDNSTVAESEGPTAGPVTITAMVERNGGVQEALSIVWAIGGTATNGTDYATVIPANIDIGANETTATTTVTILPIQDTDVEGDETIILGVTSAAYSASSTSFRFVDAVVTLTDDDTTTVTIVRKANDPNPEEGGLVTFNATFADAISGQPRITWAANPDLVGTSFTIAETIAVATAVEFTVGIEDDNLAEVEESTSVTFDVPGYISDTGNSLGPFTIVIGASDPVTVAVDGPMAQQEGSLADYTVTLGGGTRDADVNVTVAVTSGDANDVGTTSGNSDKGTLPAAMTVAIGASSATFPIAMTEDGYSAAESGERVTFTFTATGANIPSAGVTGTHTVAVSQLPTVWGRADSSTVAEDVGTATFTVHLTSRANGMGGWLATTVDWTVTHAGTNGTSDADFGGRLPSGTLTFPANDTTNQSIALSIIDDSLAEMPESFLVTLAIASSSEAVDGFNVIVRGSPASVTVTDNDQVVLELAEMTSPREGSSAEYLVRVLNDVVPTIGITVDVTITASGANPTSVSDDLGELPLQATISAGSTSATIVVPIVADYSTTGTDEDETFAIAISNPVGGGGTLAPTIATDSTNVVSTILDVPSADVNHDDVMDATDALILYFSFNLPDLVGNGTAESGFTSMRLRLLGNLASGESPTDEVLRGMITRAREWRRRGGAFGGDFNLDGRIDGEDALILYYATSKDFRFLLESDSSGQEANNLRRTFLSGFGGAPDDEEMLRQLQRASSLAR